MRRISRGASHFSICNAPDMAAFIRLNGQAILREVLRRTELPVDSFEVKALYGEVLYRLCRDECVTVNQGRDAVQLAICVEKAITSVLVRDLERGGAG